MAYVSPLVLYPDETDVDEEEEVNLEEFDRDAWDFDEDFILQQHAKYSDRNSCLLNFCATDQLFFMRLQTTLIPHIG